MTPAARTAHQCHACDAPATRHWNRLATDDEATAHHKAVDDFRVAQGLPPMPVDAAIRQAPVVMAVHGCDEHGHG